MLSYPFSGLLFQWTDGVLWMILLGLAAGASFGFVFMFFTLRTRTAYEASEISGFAQSIGYLFLQLVQCFRIYPRSDGYMDIPNVLFITTSFIVYFYFH